MEHSFSMSDINRSWTDRIGFQHTICSCGVQLTAPTSEELSRMMSEHVRKES